MVSKLQKIQQCAKGLRICAQKGHLAIKSDDE